MPLEAYEILCVFLWTLTGQAKATLLAFRGYTFSNIWTVFSSGKQRVSFRESHCFPITVSDKDQMNQGIFVGEGQNERKTENDYDFLKS